MDFSGADGGSCAGRGSEWEEAHDGVKWEGARRMHLPP
jgi:hypothetical protein